MERLRNFFYNKNDIVIALIILVIAAAVIYFRIVAIMNYPATIVAQNKDKPATTTEEKTE